LATEDENEFTKYEDLDKDEISLAVRKSVRSNFLAFND